MAMTPDEALAELGLTATPDADAGAIQRAFERLARRYPQPNFPARFRQLLEARDQLLDGGRAWRGQLEEPLLDLAWLLPYLQEERRAPEGGPTRAGFVGPQPVSASGAVLQTLLRAGYLAEPLPPQSGIPAELLARILDGKDPFQ